MKNKIILDENSETIINSTKNQPCLYELPVNVAREKLEELQNKPIYMYPVEIKKIKFNISDNKNIFVYLVIPEKIKLIKKIIFYIHGAGWTMGSFHTHEKLVRELAFRTNSIVIFPEYTRAPEAIFPIAILECFKILCNIPFILCNANLNIKNYEIIIAGDSAGGNMAASLTLLSKYKNGPKIAKVLLYYPVTNSDFNTPSYEVFGKEYYLTKKAMEWFWDQYVPNKEDRLNILASPLKASIENLKEFPTTLIINGEADVLRCDGYNFATKLMLAKVNVTQIQLKGTIHDFVMLNSLDKTSACRSAMDLSVNFIISQ